MLRRLFLALTLLAAVGGVCVHQAQALTPAQRVILLSQAGPSLDLNFLAMGGTLDSRISFSRASSATGALYTDAAGATVTTYSSGQARLTSQGLLIEQAATNYLLNSASPATQTTGSLSTGSYVFFCNGTGSVTSSAGTATATGLGSQTCSDGTYQSISVSTAGTLTFTVSGTVDWFDLQGQAFPTSHIITDSSTVTRAADVATIATSVFAYRQDMGTFCMQFILGSAVGGKNMLAMTGSGRFLGTQNTSTTSTQITTFDGTSAALTLNAVVLNTVGRAASTWRSGEPWAISANGGAIAESSSNADLTNLSAATIGIGAQNNGANGPGTMFVQSLEYWPRRLPDAQLQVLTQ